MIDKGICPVCNGDLRVAVPTGKEWMRNDRGWYSYDTKTDTVNCGNCGSQYMFGRPTGEVPVNRNGQPCRHEYTMYRPYGPFHGLSNHTCKHCDDKFSIDSSD